METSAAPAPFAPTWQLDELSGEILDALRSGGSGDGKVIDGRALAVKASPMRENSSKITVGTAALPPGFSTRPHSHDAEEVAIFLSGSGRVEIDGVAHPVRQGTVLLTPSGAGHVTISDPGEPLVVLWFYAPPGSEARWLEPDKHPTAGHAGSGDAARNEAQANFDTRTHCSRRGSEEGHSGSYSPGNEIHNDDARPPLDSADSDSAQSVAGRIAILPGIALCLGPGTRPIASRPEMASDSISMGIAAG